MENKIKKLLRKRTFPIIMKNKNGNLEIIYRNRVELYSLNNTDTFDENDEDKNPDAEHEVNMMVDCGYKRVNDSDNERWDLWGAGKEDNNNQEKLKMELSKVMVDENPDTYVKIIDTLRKFGVLI